MKRKRHIVLNVLAVASALLSMASVALWARSYTTSDYIEYIRWSTDDVSTRTVSFLSTAGRLDLKFYHVEVNPPDDFVTARRTLANYPLKTGAVAHRSTAEVKRSASSWIGGFGFSYWTWRADWHTKNRGITIPTWFLVAVTLALPFIQTGRLLAKRRTRRGNLCPSCGYDLRASPDRCPECGSKERS
jgi:hypothetical protein